MTGRVFDASGLDVRRRSFGRNPFRVSRDETGVLARRSLQTVRSHLAPETTRLGGESILRKQSQGLRRIAQSCVAVGTSGLAPMTIPLEFLRTVLTTRRGAFTLRVRRIHDRGFQFHSPTSDCWILEFSLAEFQCRYSNRRIRRRGHAGRLARRAFSIRSPERVLP